MLQYIAADDVDICIVQQLTLKAAFQASVNALPKAWLSIGQAIRVAMDLGLHVRFLRPMPGVLTCHVSAQRFG